MNSKIKHQNSILLVLLGVAIVALITLSTGKNLWNTSLLSYISPWENAGALSNAQAIHEIWGYTSVESQLPTLRLLTITSFLFCFIAGPLILIWARMPVHENSSSQNWKWYTKHTLAGVVAGSYLLLTITTLYHYAGPAYQDMHASVAANEERENLRHELLLVSGKALAAYLTQLEGTELDIAIREQRVLAIASGSLQRRFTEGPYALWFNTEGGTMEIIAIGHLSGFSSDFINFDGRKGKTQTGVTLRPPLKLEWSFYN